MAYSDQGWARQTESGPIGIAPKIQFQEPALGMRLVNPLSVLRRYEVSTPTKVVMPADGYLERHTGSSYYIKHADGSQSILTVDGGQLDLEPDIFKHRGDPIPIIGGPGRIGKLTWRVRRLGPTGNLTYALPAQLVKP